MNAPIPEFTLERDAAGVLTFIGADGQRHSKAKPVRLFPLTHPSEWVSIVDASGRELVCLERMEVLPEPVRKTLEEALASRDFVPVIRSVKDVHRAASGHVWTVVTDRGPAVFVTESEESIQMLTITRLVIIDQGNTRYLVPDIRTLDPKSRQRIERYF